MTTFNEAAREPIPEKPKRHPHLCRKFVTAIFVILIAGIICWHIHHPRAIDPPPGTMCTVQFRRDVLGAAHDLPIGPTTNNINGAIVSMTGELIAVSREAILLDQVNEHYIVNDVPQMKRFWIPRSGILFIEYEPARTFLDLPQDNSLRIQYNVMQNIKTSENQ